MRENRRSRKDPRATRRKMPAKGFYDFSCSLAIDRVRTEYRNPRVRCSRGFRDGPNVPWVLGAFADRREVDRRVTIDQMIENLVEFAVVALLGVVTALACTRFLSAPNKPENHKVG